MNFHNLYTKLGIPTQEMVPVRGGPGSVKSLKIMISTKFHEMSEIDTEIHGIL